MSWAFATWQDFLKKKACRFFLNHYLGQFLKEKLSLDQLSLDLYNGTGKISDLNLDVQAINEDLKTYGVPVELVDGFVERICITIPWSALVQDSTQLEVTGLELTLQPKQRDDSGMMAGEMFSSMQSSMTTSLQLAKDCLEAETKDPVSKSEPIEGVQKFANMIDSVLSKVRVTLKDTVIRLEHHPTQSAKGVALEIRIKRIEYFDDMATVTEGTSVDGNWEPSAIVQKNFHIDGVQVFFDEITHRKTGTRSRSSSAGSQQASQMFASSQSSLFSTLDADEQTGFSRSASHSSSSSLESCPVQVAIVTGRQDIKLRTKQNDTMHGPKLEILCQFGAIHLLMSPWQMHGLIELISGLNSPMSSESSSYSGGLGIKNKPMEDTDFQRVESELQHQLKYGRIQSNNLAQMQDYSLHGDEDDQFFSLMSNRPGGASDMDSSFSSNISGLSNRTSSTVPSMSTHKGPGKQGKDVFAPPKYHEDPSAELSHFQVRLAFISATLLHNNPSPHPSDDLGRSRAEVMKEVAVGFFRMVAGVTSAGMTELREIRKQFAALLSLDHLRFIGRPLNVECTQKVAMKQVSTNLHVTVGVAELVETLYNTRNQQPQPEISEILTFRNDGTETKKSAMYSSMQGGSPCFTMDIKSIFSHKMSSRQGSLPRTDITINLGELQSEVDLTLIDRINSLVTMETFIDPSPLTGASMYHTVGTQYYSIAHTLDEGPSSQDQRFNVQVSSPSARISLRFPIPDLRQEPHVDKSWYQRNLRDDALTLQLDDMRLQTTFSNNQPLEQIQISSSEIHGYFKFKYNEDEIHFAHVTGEGGEEGFNNPTFTLRFCSTTTSILDEVDMYNDDITPGDSLNGACEFAKVEPSPFSSRRNMYDKEQMSDQAGDKSEQMVLPADREEMAEFMQKSISNTQMVVDIVLPNACVFLPDKHFFEVLYNRLNNDLLLWEPTAPAPMTSSKETFSMAHTVDLNVYDQLHGLHGPGQFSLAQSGIQYDSDSDSDNESTNHYSIHDSRYPRRKKSPRQQQSKLCLNLNICKGRLTAFTQAKDTSGTVVPDKHGEVLIQMSDFSLFTVSAHNGDPNLQYLNILVNRADLYHHPCVEHTELRPLVDCSELSAPVPPHLQSRKAIYRSEAGVLVNTRDDIGRGLDTMDMVSVALKIKLDTMASKCDLTTDEKVKEFVVAVGLRGATMRHKMLPPYQHLFLQMMDFLDVKDYPILGYIDPKVLTELHVHLWTCAIDYRPLNLPLKSLLLADSFSISSNIVAESSMSVLRFVLDDGALFLSKKIKAQRTDVRKDYVCVTDIGQLELLLKSYDGKDLRYPRTDLRISTNRINIRTCADSCIELINLIQYLAADGDLLNADEIRSEIGEETEADLSSATDEVEETEEQSENIVQQTLTVSSMDHVHNLMSEAMRESSESDHSSPALSPEVSQTDRRTEVFFVPETGQGMPGSPGSSRQPIIITQNVDSVTTSLASAMEDSDEDFCDSENSDDFCMIDDTSWGKAPKDGQPTIRVFHEASVDIKDNFFWKPVGRTDLLKAPDNFPPAESRYTLKELTLVWYIYGGSDFTDIDCYNTGGDRVVTDTSRDGMSISYHRGSSCDRWLGQAGGREAPILPRETLTSKGGPGRDQSKCMELQLTKVRFQYDNYPSTTEQASRQVLLVNDIEIRDRLKTSKINKFLYQYSSEDMPRQTYTNMVHIKAVHRRPNPAVLEEEECALKLSLQPIRLNIDQDTLFFLKAFILDVACVETTDQPPSSEPAPPVTRGNTGATPPPPVMTVNKPDQGETTQDTQDLLMQFDELTQDLQASLRASVTHSDQSGGLVHSTSSTSSSATVTSESSRPVQPVFFKSFVFAPDVPIRLDYHGKFDREHGTLGGLGGLVSLNKAELKLKHISYKQGLLGADRLVTHCLNEWLTDIRVNQLPTILGGFGPMHSFVQLAHGLKDLFWLPVEQYRKDGRIVRGIQRGATSFSMSTAMSFLELTNRVVQGVQWCAELTFDMVSPGPRRRGYYPRQPSDLREGVTNAYIVLREGFSDTATTLVDAVALEHRSKGMIGAVGGAIRQIPPTIVQPLIIVPEAASNLIGGLRSQLKPEVRKDDEDKWKEEIID